MKYLAIVESALNPTATSRAGAKGLWQFMYPTGKMYGLEVSSVIDDRCDVYKSTDAASRYLRDLYKIYGNWELALAAYNCGPGNVNKAIRRSGGKTNYWQLWSYLRNGEWLY
jgi:membrane-bound lytic murein transglycosylase D